jgi:hypothetical protein
MSANRPSTDTQCVTTPNAAAMVDLLGGIRSGPITLTADEFCAIERLYGYVPEKPTKKPPPPDPPPLGASYEDRRRHEIAVRAHNNWTDPRVLMQAGADVHMLRHAEADGLHLLAWLARFVPAGEDPLKTLVQLAVDAGWDVDPGDAAWAASDDSGDTAA